MDWQALVDLCGSEKHGLLSKRSFLGGEGTVEGVVVKAYDVFDYRTSKPLMAKLVSADFRETHGKSWKARNPSGRDILQLITDNLRTEPRWEKGLQSLRDAGELTGTLRDIGPLIKTVQRDTMVECEALIKQALFDGAKGKIEKGLARGVADWYKGKLSEAVTQEAKAE